MPRLLELEARFITYLPKAIGKAATLAEADGVLFLCPLCFVRNNGPVGTHAVLCWFQGRPAVPPDATPGPGRWQVAGSGIDDLTLSPSVHLSGEGGCQWHGYVKGGDTL